MASHQFRLYVTGRSMRSQMAVANLERLCAREFGSDADVEVIDVLADPGRAETDRILTTPTLIRLQPEPVRRLTGDLSDEKAVLRGLGLNGPGSASASTGGRNHG